MPKFMPTCLLFCSAIFLSCGTEPGDEKITISGISRTFENGMQGLPDPDDWNIKVVSGPTESWAFVSPAFPNPVSSTEHIWGTTIVCQLLKSASVRFYVINARQQRLRTLFEGQLDSGEYSIPWDLRDDDRNMFAPGLYRMMIEITATEDPSHRLTSYGDVQINP